MRNLSLSNITQCKLLLSQLIKGGCYNNLNGGGTYSAVHLYGTDIHTHRINCPNVNNNMAEKS